MTAYLDTSCVVSIALGERDSAQLVRRLAAQEQVLSSNLLEAELRSVLARENSAADISTLLSGILWVFPERPLTSEFAEVLKAGYVRGADLWHLAVALYVDPRRKMTFLTLDDRQIATARALNFRT